MSLRPFSKLLHHNEYSKSIFYTFASSKMIRKNWKWFQNSNSPSRHEEVSIPHILECDFWKLSAEMTTKNRFVIGFSEGFPISSYLSAHELRVSIGKTSILLTSGFEIWCLTRFCGYRFFSNGATDTIRSRTSELCQRMRSTRTYILNILRMQRGNHDRN